MNFLWNYNMKKIYLPLKKRGLTLFSLSAAFCVEDMWQATEKLKLWMNSNEQGCSSIQPFPCILYEHKMNPRVNETTFFLFSLHPLHDASFKCLTSSMHADTSPTQIFYCTTQNWSVIAPAFIGSLSVHRGWSELSETENFLMSTLWTHPYQ